VPNAPRHEQSAVTRLATSCQTCHRVAEPSPARAVLHVGKPALTAARCYHLGSQPELSASEIACSLSVVSEITKPISVVLFGVGLLFARWALAAAVVIFWPTARPDVGTNFFNRRSSFAAVLPTGRCVLETVAANRLALDWRVKQQRSVNWFTLASGLPQYHSR
jgi:hypothetical protein